MDITLGLFNAGTDSQVDVAEAETVVQQARATVAQYVTTVATDKNALDLEVGAPVPDRLLPDGISDETMVMQTLPVGLSSSVLLTRPDVLEAEHTLKSANAHSRPPVTSAAAIPT